MSFRQICTAVFFGRRWKVGFGWTGKTDGLVDDGVCRYHKEMIVIRRKARGRGRSLEEIVIHECAHAAFPLATEDQIEKFGSTTAKVLAKLKAAEPDQH
jgi:hypothetical protein